MCKTNPNIEESFFIGMLYSCEYGKKDNEIELFFKKREMYDFIEKFLINKNIEYKIKFEGVRVLINIESFEKLKDFLDCFDISIDNIIYHEIPFFIQEEEIIYRNIFYGILEMSGMTISNKEKDDFIRIYCDSENLSNFIRNILNKNKIKFLENKISLSNIAEENINLFDITKNKDFFKLLSLSNFLEYSKYREIKNNYESI